MTISGRKTGKTTSEIAPIYRSSFVSHSHQILKMGYDRLDAPSFSQHEEEVITGELTRSMLDAIQDRAAPRWAKNFWVNEEIRVHEPTRLGKKRLRIDIEIIQSQMGPRPRFRFEAKRLFDSSSRRDYLGHDGIGCFLDGRYAKEDSIAGMLGYVQRGSVDLHAKEVEKALKADPKRYGLLDEDQWILTKFNKAFESYRSTHHRKNELPRMTLQHTFLDFCQH